MVDDFEGEQQTAQSVPWAFIDELGKAQDLNLTLEVMARWVPRFVQADRVSITLVNDDGGLDLLAVEGIEVSPVGTTFPVEGTLVGKAYCTRETVNVSDVAGDTIDGSTLIAAGMRSCLVAPLLSADRCFGTFNLASAEPDFYQAEHERIVGALASFVASFARAHFETEEYQRRARIDSLTGLLNRSGLMAELEKKFADKSGSVCLLFLDLDGFKAINDAYGHTVGDKMLTDMSARFRKSLRPEDLLGRIGGDEFIVICDPGDEPDAGTKIADRLIEESHQQLEVGPTKLMPRVSIGVVVADTATETAEGALTEADLAMYEAKKTKRVVVVADEELRSRAEIIAAIDRDLDRAMEIGEIAFAFQPIWKIETGRLSGAESLIRWDHPTHGPIPPPVLIDRVEATDRVEQFTEWSLNVIAGHVGEMHNHDPVFRSVPVAINLTPQQLSWTNYVNVHLETLNYYGLDPKDLVVELVESGVVEVGTSAEATLKALAVENVFIALDDFGTGSNALGYFTRFHIDAIKIDRSLISSMTKSEPVRTIVEGLGSMARGLGIQVVGEGIETKAEMDLCRRLGIDHGQGFYLGRPMPIEQLMELAPVAALTRKF